MMHISWRSYYSRGVCISANYCRIFSSFRSRTRVMAMEAMPLECLAGREPSRWGISVQLKGLNANMESSGFCIEFQAKASSESKLDSIKNSATGPETSRAQLTRQGRHRPETLIAVQNFYMFTSQTDSHKSPRLRPPNRTFYYSGITNRFAFTGEKPVRKMGGENERKSLKQTFTPPTFPLRESTNGTLFYAAALSASFCFAFHRKSCKRRQPVLIDEFQYYEACQLCFRFVLRRHKHYGFTL